VINKDLLIATFLDDNPIFKSIRERYQKKYLPQYGEPQYADADYQTAQTAILYDIYKNHALKPSSTGEFTDKILDTYVDRFHTKYAQYKSSAKALMYAFQHRIKPSTLASNNLPQNKPNSKPK